MTPLKQYLETLISEGAIIDTVWMNPPPEEDLGVTVELYAEPSPFVEFYNGAELVARVNLG
jgi:hypothetical protein